MLQTEKTVAAIATAQAAGGVGIVRISGPEATNIADRVFKGVSGKKLVDSLGYRAYFGRICGEKEDIDECVALVFREPHSYTGEDVVELSCHGGLFVLKQVLRLVLASGAEPAKPGEFTQRAFMHGKMDLTQAQAVMDMVSAQGKQAAQAALTALDGALSRKINENCEKLISAAANMAAWVDYPDEEIEELQDDVLKETLKTVYDDLTVLANSFDTGKIITQGVDTAIVGRPNVGKSTLMNLLAGYRRSIVTEYAGTTRDVVEETVKLGEIVLHLADTAGIRESDNPVESIGVEIAKEKLQRAELIIAVFDGSEELNRDDMDILEICRDKNCIAVINKTDLPQKNVGEIIREYTENVVEIAASRGEGSDKLEEVASHVLGTDKIDTTSAMIVSERQYKCTVEAAQCVKDALDDFENGMTLDAINVSIDYAIEKLSELTGKRATQAVVDEVFSKFCVGK